MADFTEVGLPASESLNRVWRPMSPFLLFGWKTSIWILNMLYALTFLYTLFVVFRTLKGIPILLVTFYFATAPFQADQQIFIDYVSLVFECLDQLFNLIFRPILNDLMQCFKPLCCIHNYIVETIRLNIKLFLDFFRGLLIEWMPEVLESEFGIPANVVEDIMDFLDLSLPPGFPCDASSGPTTSYLECIIENLELEPPSEDILDCRGFIHYKKTMTAFYGVPYDVLIHANKRDGGLTVEGIMISYVELNETRSNTGKNDEFGEVDDNEWGVYQVRGGSERSGKRDIRRSSSRLNGKDIELREIRMRVERAVSTPAVHDLQGRNISSFFPGFESGDTYNIAVLEVACDFFNGFFEDFWDIFLGIFFTVYDIAWNFIQFVLDFGFTDFTEFFLFIIEYIFDVILDIPCLDFSSGNNFVVSLVNCPCALMANELGFTYFPAVGDDSDTYLAALFSCAGFDCAVDDDGVADIERFYSACIVQSFLDLMCIDNDDCTFLGGGFSCQFKIFITGITVDSDIPPDVTITREGWCLPDSKKRVMIQVYAEKVRMQDQQGATVYGAPDNSSVVYWKHMRDTSVERYSSMGQDVPNTLEDLIEKEWNNTMGEEARVWVRSHSPNKVKWLKMAKRTPKDMHLRHRKVENYQAINTIINRADFSPWIQYGAMAAKRSFEKANKRASLIGVPVHTVDWNTYGMDGRPETINGIPVQREADDETSIAYELIEGDDDYITPPNNIDDDSISMEDLSSGETLEDIEEGTSEGYTRMQLMLLAFSDVIGDNMKVLNNVRWDPLEYNFKTPTTTDMKSMFKRLDTSEKYGAMVRHLREGAREQREMAKSRGILEPSPLAQFSTTVKLLVTRFMAPRLLPKVSRELESRSPYHAAAVKRVLPSLTEGHDVDKLVEEIIMGNTTIWDMTRYSKVLRRHEMRMMRNHTYVWAMQQRKKHLRGDYERISSYMQHPPLDPKVLEFGSEPVVMQRTRAVQLPVMAFSSVLFQLVLPILKNPKLIASFIQPILTSRWGLTIIENTLRVLGRPLEVMYSEGLVPTLGTPEKLAEFAEDFGMTMLFNVIFLIEEFDRYLLCNYWIFLGKILSTIMQTLGFIIPFIMTITHIITGIAQGINQTMSLVAGYCPPKPVLENGLPVDLPWNYIFKLIDCDIDTMCKISSDCISNAPCRCAPTMQYESFLWELNGDRDGPPCEDGGGMPTGFCLCWPNLPCDLIWPEIDSSKPFDGNCKEDFGYQTGSVATWQTPGFRNWFSAIAVNWYKGAQFLTRGFSQGRKRYLSNNVGFLLMAVSLGIASLTLGTKWWIIILLIWVSIMFVWVSTVHPYIVVE